MKKVLRRLRDGFVTALLRSPLHRPLSGSLVLITFTGRRTGRKRTRPVMYAQDDAGLIIFVGQADKKVWWRNLTERAPVRARVRGIDLDGYGEVVRGDPSLAATYLARFPRAREPLTEARDPVFVRLVDLRRA